MSSTKFLIVEDHPEVAENNCNSLRKLEPDCYCITVQTPEEALERLKLEIPDLVILDLLYGSISGEQSAEPGLALLRQIFKQYPTLNVLVYSSEPKALMPLLPLIETHHGGFSVTNKMERRQVFLEEAQVALKGGRKIPKELLERPILDERDLEMLHLLCQECLTDQAIADRLHVSKRSAQNYIQRLKEKLEVDTIDGNIANTRQVICRQALRLGFLR
jgi:DNA-binding NarL/FixJ family response regulator